MIILILERVSIPFLLPNNIIQQEAQGIQAFAFCVVTVNDKHAEPRLKRKRRG